MYDKSMVRKIVALLGDYSLVDALDILAAVEFQLKAAQIQAYLDEKERQEGNGE